MIVGLAGSLGLGPDRVQLLHPRPQDPQGPDGSVQHS